ncbi:MAG: glycosyltransferase family 4 protein [Opitutaceae bacterium]|nr:glycosyltransferase family 4 protein [Opitutaceae bacterium]MBP9912177.1 glycosyltransferase family 4 protein [Opitutaceae bacterium]
MFESLHGFLHLDQPVADVPVAAGLVSFHGWAAGPRGLPLVDLRLRLQGKIFPIAHGFPRVDLVTHYGLNQPFLPAGFEASLYLPPGRHDIVIEALTLAGTWHAIATVQVRTTGDAPPPPPTAQPLVQPWDFSRALRLILRQTALMPLGQAVRAVADALPHPVVVRYPHLPFHGHCDQPALLELVRFGRLNVDGWLFHETATIRRVVATVDLQTWQDLQPAGATPHVAALFPQFPTAQHCGINGVIDIPAQLPAPLRLRTYAQLSDGSWHLCQIQHTHPWDQEQEKAAFAPFSQIRFARAVLGLWRACRARKFELRGSRALWQAIRQVQQEYRWRALPAPPSPLPPAAPDPATPAPHLKQVILVTHNLSREGAPLLLWEFGRYLISQGVKIKVLSPTTGPLAALYTGLGATVAVVDLAGLLSAQTAGELDRAIDHLAARIDVTEADLVVANTLPTYWAVHLAKRAQCPSLFCIHESTTPAHFHRNVMAPGTLALIEATFRLATQVTFPTETTRVYYRPWLGAANHSVNPSWIDVQMIDRYLATHPRAALRQQLGLRDHEQLVVNIGIFCDRKGQHIFARSVDLLWRRDPALAAACQFLMVGGRDTAYDRHLADLVAQLARPNLRIIPATDTPLDYLGAADLAVCTSYEESFPRVVMEAMAARVPILSTGVHGIGDMLASGRSGWLVPAGETHALTDGLHHLLSHPTLARTYAEAARVRVVEHFDAAVLLPRQTALAENTGRPHR